MSTLENSIEKNNCCEGDNMSKQSNDNLLKLIDTEDIPNNEDYELVDVDYFINASDVKTNNTINNSFIDIFSKFNKLQTSIESTIKEKYDINESFNKSGNANDFFTNIVNDIKDILQTDDNFNKTLDELNLDKN